MENSQNMTQNMAQSPAGQTTNPQAVTGASLQQPGGDNLQTTASHSIPDINNMDNGGQAISLGGISNTTMANQAPLPAKTVHDNLWLGGGLVLLIVVFIVALYYGLMRQA